MLLKLTTEGIPPSQLQDMSEPTETIGYNNYEVRLYGSTNGFVAKIYDAEGSLVDTIPEQQKKANAIQWAYDCIDSKTLQNARELLSNLPED